MELSARVTQAEFGKAVGISQQAVSGLVLEGVLVQGGTAGEWLRAYCGRLREQAAGRATMIEGLDLPTERAALAREQRLKLARENAIADKEVAPVHVIEQILAKAGARVAALLDAIPGNVRRRLPSLPSTEIDEIRREIARARKIAAAVSLHDLQDEQPAEEDESVAALEAGDGSV